MQNAHRLSNLTYERFSLLMQGNHKRAKIKPLKLARKEVILWTKTRKDC